MPSASWRDSPRRSTSTRWIRTVGTGTGITADSERGLRRCGVRSGGARRLRERGDEPIPLPRHGRDEPWLAPVVLELCAEVADMAVDDVALGHVVDVPEGVQ